MSTKTSTGLAFLDAIGEAIEYGQMPSLKTLVVNTEDKENPRLKAACEQQHVMLVALN